MSSSSSNPYLTAAMADRKTAKLIIELSRLINDEADGQNPYQSVSEPPQTTGTYTSAVSPPPATSKKSSSAYLSAADSSTASPGYQSAEAKSPAPSPPKQPSYHSEFSPKEDTSPPLPEKPKPLATNSSYLSPKESWHLEKQQKQQAALEAQRQAAQRRQQQQAAKRFLAKLDKLDPLEGTRMWFEDFAKLCPSRLEAAIEFLATVPSTNP